MATDAGGAGSHNKQRDRADTPGGRGHVGQVPGREQQEAAGHPAGAGEAGGRAAGQGGDTPQGDGGEGEEGPRQEGVHQEAGGAPLWAERQSQDY